MRDELLYLGNALDRPQHPMAAVIGGAKVSTKIEVLQHLMPKIDKLLVGGAMVYTFHRAMGHSVGDSLVEEDCISVARGIMEMAEQEGVAIILAADSRVSNFSLTAIAAVERKSEGKSVEDRAASVLHQVTHEGKSKTGAGQLTDLLGRVVRVVSNTAIPDGCVGADIGPETVSLFVKELQDCKTVLWNGALRSSLLLPVLCLTDSIVRNVRILCRSDGNV